MTFHTTIQANATVSPRVELGTTIDCLLSGREKVSLFRLDLDRFKSVDEALGFAAGDGVLTVMSERIRSRLSTNDRLIKLGRDEFAILRPGEACGDDTAAFATELIELAGRPCLVQGALANVGLSIGFATALHAGSATGGDVLVRQAELALHCAKADGGNIFRMFDPAMDQRLAARRLLEFDLRKAVTLREFELFYQPQADLRTGELIGFEALLRWRHPERGMVSPLEFIPVAEEIGLIAPIGAWALSAACRQAAKWPAATSMAVNISPLQFRSGRLLDTVTSVLAESGLPPERLELEITETVLLSDSARNLAMLNQLRDLGVRIAMDDFGTGYSSLSYLSSFPFDKIKIDKSFVQQMLQNRSCEAIVRAVAGLGQSLGIATIAEGVETLEQLARVRACGCNSIQGYLFGKPLPATEIAALLSSESLKLDHC